MPTTIMLVANSFVAIDEAVVISPSAPFHIKPIIML